MGGETSKNPGWGGKEEEGRGRCLQFTPERGVEVGGSEGGRERGRRPRSLHQTARKKTSGGVERRRRWVYRTGKKEGGALARFT